jgi:hypothetical protein
MGRESRAGTATTLSTTGVLALVDGFPVDEIPRRALAKSPSRMGGGGGGRIVPPPMPPILDGGSNRVERDEGSPSPTRREGGRKVSRSVPRAFADV